MIIIRCFSSLLVILSWSEGSKFDPYELNGGLISGVAGKGYVILGSDTRLSSGYGILSRSYLQSRLWRVSSCLEEESMLDEYGSIIIPSCSEKETKMNVWDGAFIGSSGCAADCETLKRAIQSEVYDYSFWLSSSVSKCLSASHISNLLSNVLYSRRNFPFYSFCVTGGFDENSDEGVVHAFDAIGSHERVAVATSGTGREMLQPILDRLFSESTYQKSLSKLQRDENAVLLKEQRKGLLEQHPPVRVSVDCDLEEAVSLLVHAYRSVSEREIAVGDDVVICILRKKESTGSLEVRRFPLKKH